MVLSNSSISVYIFHMIRAFSFLQIVFCIFYRVEIKNEYSTDKIDVNKNSSKFNFFIKKILDLSFTIEEYLRFSNFQFFVMGSSTSQFLTLYGILSGLLIGMIALLFFLSEKIFMESKSQDLKEGSNTFIMKASAYLITLYLYVF